MCAGVLCPARGTSDLWKEYEAAQRSDKPQKQLEILEKIGKAAESKRLHWDFYRYWNEKVNTVSSINWKLRDSVSKARKEALKRYNEPVVSVSSTYLWDDSALKTDFIRENADVLRNGRNTEFWKRLPDDRRRCVANDYEYAVWNCAPNDTAMLRGMLMERHSKEAVDLMYGMYAIEAAFDSLQMYGGEGAEFRQLYGRCIEFNELKKRFSGEDAKLAACFRVDGITDALTAKTIRISSGTVGESGADTTIAISVNNVRTMNLIVSKEGKPVYKTTVTNTRNSFHRTDIIAVPIPDTGDGDYEITCVDTSDKNVRDVGTLKRNTISAACRPEKNGWSIFAFDNRTKKPCGSVEITVAIGGDTLKTSAGGFAENGFVPLPASAADWAMKKNKYGHIQCSFIDSSGRKRLSPYVYLRRHRQQEECRTVEHFTDRPFYSPGDTVRFKALSYKFKRGLYAQVCAGVNLQVELRTPDGGCVDSCAVTTNEFGSAEGRLVIPEEGRNGGWTLLSKIRGNGTDRYLKRITVENPALTTYSIEFDDEGKSFIIGKEAVVKGTLRRLDGQGIGDAAISYCVRRHQFSSADDTVASGQVIPDRNGRFSFGFKTRTFDDGPYSHMQERYEGYDINAVVTDGTGETVGFSTYRDCRDIDYRVTFPDAGADYPADVVLKQEVRAVFSSYFFKDVKIGYALRNQDSITVCEGICTTGDTLTFNMKGLPDGQYFLKTGTVGEEAYNREWEYPFFKLNPEAPTLCSGIDFLLLHSPGEEPFLKMGTGTSDKWVCILVSDPDGTLLDNRIVHLEGKKGEIKKIKFGKMMAENAKADVIVFDGNNSYLEKVLEMKTVSRNLPVSFNGFNKELHPRETRTVSLKTQPGTEAVIAVYDKELESFAKERYRSPEPSLSKWTTTDISLSRPLKEFRSTAVRSMAKMTVAANSSDGIAETSVQEESIPFALANDAYGAPAEGVAGGTLVRTDFRKALAFIPFARADENGTISFEVTASDKTSTFVVDVFAHNKDMKCAVADTEIVVKIPLQITVNEPRFLRIGDLCTVSGTVHNSTAAEICDTLEINGAGMPFSVPAEGTANFKHPLRVPRDASQATLAVSFATDAIVKKIPVINASQPIVEAHSAVLPFGADRDSIRKALESQFVNFSSSEASEKEVSILDMLHEALPKQIDTSSRNAISLSGGILSAELAGIENLASTREELRGRLAACRNADGGFGWMPGMKSSPVVTAVVLERLARCSGFEALSHPAAAYLDSVFIRTFGDKSKLYSGIPLPQYLYVRSMYPQVDFNAAGADGKTLKALRKEVKRFLTPGCNRGLQGEILTKTRRALTLGNLASSPQGVLLAEALGIKALTQRKLEKSQRRDIASLREYAVKHPSGGTYFPNAVMPWRGLLESELYAHTLLHRALGDDDICLWMMLQKETQKWSSDPACTDAVAETLTSGETVLNTKVLALRASREMPLEEIRATGNGMSIKREILRGRKPLAEGDTLHTGERITVRCTAKSDENRSFVVLKAPHAASIRPINQKSGFDWNTGAYRNVTPQATEYWFDVFPEEGFTFSEDFFVVQEGSFASGVYTVESLYADHYRANDENCYLCSLNDK